jgi:hypothetical protein
MAEQGLAIPVRASQGRAVISSGDRKNAEVIMLSMASGESTNPFNDDVGLEAPVLHADSAGNRALLTKRIREHFDRLEAADRCKLSSVDVRPADAGGDQAVHVDYIDIETDEELEAERKIARGW